MSSGSENRFDFLELPGNYRLPEGYELEEGQIHQLNEPKDDELPKRIFTFVNPVLIEEQFVDPDTHQIYLKLVFRKHGQIKDVIVSRSTICSASKILQLSDFGVPVHSGNARHLVQFLNLFEEFNQNLLKTQYIFTNNGWKSFDYEKVFVLGNNILSSRELSKELLFKPEPDFVTLGKAIECRGDFNSWKELVEPLLSYPKLAFALYSSFAAPLLSLIEAPNFIVHFWGNTSIGKTTTLALASSIWGQPEQGSGGLIIPWNTTRFYVEQSAWFYNHLPLFKDDCQAADDALLSDTLFMLANRVGKGRGTRVGSIQTPPSWYSICLSTGEKPLTDTTSFHGAKARTIEIEGSPFEGRDPETVNLVRNTLRKHYGHAGPRFINHLLQANRFQLETRYEQFRQELGKYSTDVISDRMSHYFAVVWLAAELVEKSLGLATDYQSTILQMFQESITANNDPLEIKALKLLIEFAQQNAQHFAYMSNHDPIPGEHWGVWKENRYLAIKKEILTNLLAEHDLNITTILDKWDEKNWLKRDGRQRTYSISYKNTPMKMVTIKWMTIKQI